MGRKVSTLAELIALIRQLMDGSIERLICDSQSSQEQQRAILDELRSQRALIQRLSDAILPGPASRVEFTIHIDSHILSEISSMQLKDRQQSTITLTFPDDAGRPAPVDGIPQWSVDDPTLLMLVPAADGLSAVVKAGDKLGKAKVTATADADLTEGIRMISGDLDIEVISRGAKSVVLNAGPASDLDQLAPSSGDQPIPLPSDTAAPAPSAIPAAPATPPASGDVSSQPGTPPA